MTDELLIIKKVLAGEVNAFAVLVDRYKDFAVTLAYNVVLNKEDAEDIVQDAFIKAYSSLCTFRGSAKFSTWLYRIVLNTALNKRKVKKFDTVAIADHLGAEEESIIGTELCNYSKAQQQRYIQLALQGLSEGERLCISMYYLQELSMEEIGELTGFAASNIKVLLHRGRKRLYQELQMILKKELKNLL